MNTTQTTGKIDPTTTPYDDPTDPNGDAPPDTDPGPTKG